MIYQNEEKMKEMLGKRKVCVHEGTEGQTRIQTEVDIVTGTRMC